MHPTDSLAGNLLIAMPGLADPNFHRTVVLLGAHSIEDGAFGLVVNRALEVELSDVLTELGQEAPSCDLPQVLAGGPVEPGHGFVLFEIGDELPANDDLVLPTGLTISGSSETLTALAHEDLPRPYSLVLGYAGWHPGQLEVEIEENSWLVAPLATSIIFETSLEDRWVAALGSIGVDPGTLVDAAGSGPPA